MDIYDQWNGELIPPLDIGWNIQMNGMVDDWFYLPVLYNNRYSSNKIL